MFERGMALYRRPGKAPEGHLSLTDAVVRFDLPYHEIQRMIAAGMPVLRIKRRIWVKPEVVGKWISKMPVRRLGRPKGS